MLQNTSIFSSDPQLARRTLAILVQVSHNSSNYSTVVIINRRVDSQKVGLSLSETPAGSSYLDTALKLQAFVSPLTSCLSDASYRVDFFWKVGDEPATSPFGSSIIVTSTTSFSYAVNVRVVDHNGKLVFGSAGYGNIGARTVPLAVVVNGGLSSVTLPPDLDSYYINAKVLSASVLSKVLFDWTCIELPQRVACRAPLWNANNRRVSSFNITTKGIKIGTSVEYFVKVSDGDVSTMSPKMVLTVGPNSTTSFPETVTRTYGNTDPATIATDFNFECFERAIWSWDVQSDSDLSPFQPYFWLKQDASSDANIFDENPDALLTYNGYWTIQNRSSRLLGVDLSALDTGQYTLYGTAVGDANSVPTHSWNLSVRPCVTAFLSDSSGWDGVANQTVFHVSAFTKPALQAVYVLTLQGLNSTMRDFQPQEKLLRPSSQLTQNRTEYATLHFSRTTRGLSNGATISFVVPFVGNFSIIIDVYDASGSRLLTSVRSAYPINVSSSSDTKSLDNENTLTNAILQSDHDTVISILKTIPAQTNFSKTLMEALTTEFMLLSSNRSPSVVTVADTVQALTSFVSLDVSKNSTRRVFLRGSVERLVASSLAQAAGEGALRSPLQNFYASIGNALGSSDSQPSHESVIQEFDETRQSAANTFSVLLSTGLECGSVQQAFVSFGPGDHLDEYRLGTECYPGQVNALPPEPYTFEACASEGIPLDSTVGNIVMTTGQVDTYSGEGDANILRSPIIETVFLRRVTDLNEVSVTTLPQPSVCYRTRLVVNISGLTSSLNFRQSQDFNCHDAGEIVVRSANASQDASFRVDSTVSDFNVANETHISVSTLQTESVAVQLRLNATTLQQCQDTNVSVQAGVVKIVPILIGLVIAVGLILIIIIILCLVRRKEKPLRWTIPRDGRGWDSMLESASYTPSSDGSFGFVGRGSSAQITGWDTAYEVRGNIRAGSVLVDNERSGTFNNHGFVGEDVLAYGDRSVEELGANRTWSGHGGSEALRFDPSRLGEGSEDDLTSGDRGTSDTSGLTTPIRSHSATISSSTDGFIRSSGSSTEDEEILQTYILEDVFGRNFGERRESV